MADSWWFGSLRKEAKVRAHITYTHHIWYSHTMKHTQNKSTRKRIVIYHNILHIIFYLTKLFVLLNNECPTWELGPTFNSQRSAWCRWLFLFPPTSLITSSLHHNLQAMRMHCTRVQNWYSRALYYMSVTTRIHLLIGNDMENMVRWASTPLAHFRLISNFLLVLQITTSSQHLTSCITPHYLSTSPVV